MVASVGRVGLALFVVAGIAISTAACSTGPTSGGTERITATLTSSNIITRNYDNTRDGANVTETSLTTANVATGTFGKLFDLDVDDEVYAGLLYVPQVTIGGATHEVIYVATVNNSVYAFDAGTGAALWTDPHTGNNHVNLGGGFPPVNHTQVGCSPYLDFDGNIGIIGTPVIDTNSLAMYVVARTYENGTFFQRLHVLDITTGQDLVSPYAILSDYIDPKNNNQRAALALSPQGYLFVAWGSHCDANSWHGIVMSFEVPPLTPIRNVGGIGTIASFDAATYNDPTGSEAGIWMAGAGPVIDSAGYVYYASGNGNHAYSGLAQSLIQLDPSYFPSGIAGNAAAFRPQAYMNSLDDDFGSSGPIIIPGSGVAPLLMMGGKNADCYVVLTNGMTEGQAPWTCVDPDHLQPNGETHHLHNSMVSWQSPEGVNIYSWGENDYGRAWRLIGGTTVNTTAVSTTSILPPVGMPGGMMTLSANGSSAGTGILWASMPLSGDANHATVPGALYAFNAEALNQELWSSANLSSGVDSPGNFSKGSIPIVANGRVYLASLSHTVSVYALRLPPAVITADTSILTM